MIDYLNAELIDSGYDPRLLKFFRDLDRSKFITGKYKSMASEDSPLPIGFGQTISQPTLVLEMTRLLDLLPSTKVAAVSEAANSQLRVLEIGTGSGYQTAFLARFATEVYTLEIVPELSRRARNCLSELGFDNIHYRIGDGGAGWPEMAPFDRIIVTAGGPQIPPPLIEQLKPGGRLLMPAGSRQLQNLILLTVDSQTGEIHQRTVTAVRFVDLKGEHGYV